MIQRVGLVIPNVIGYGALALGLAALISGVGFYFDVTNRINNIERRMTAIEDSTIPAQAALSDIRAAMARLEAQMSILLSERRTPPFGNLGRE